MKRRMIGAAVAAVLLIAGAMPAVASDDDDSLVVVSLICWLSSPFVHSTTVRGHGTDDTAARAMAEATCAGVGSLTRPARQEDDTSVDCWINHYLSFPAATVADCRPDYGYSTTRPDPPTTIDRSVICWTDYQTSTTFTETGATASAATAAARQRCRDWGGSTTRPAKPSATVTCWTDYRTSSSITRTGSTASAANAAATKACTDSGGSTTRPARPVPSRTVRCWTDWETSSVITRSASNGNVALAAAQNACTDNGGSLTKPRRPVFRASLRCWTDHNTSTSFGSMRWSQAEADAEVRQMCADHGGSPTRPPASAPTPPPAERNEDLQGLVEGILCWFTLPDLRSEERTSALDCIGAGGSTTKPLPPSPQHQIPEVPLTSSPDPDWPSVTVTCWLSRDSSTPVTQSGSTEANARGAAIRACRDDHDGTITKPPAPPTTYSSSVTCWVSRDPVCEGVIGSCKPASSTVTRTAATFDDASAAARKACVDSGGSLNRPATPPPVTCWISPADGSSRVDLGEVMQGPAGDSECNRRKARWREENENAPIMPPADAEKPPDKTQDENYREAFRRSRGGSSGGGVRGGSRGGGVRGGGGGGGGMPPYFDDDILP